MSLLHFFSKERFIAKLTAAFAIVFVLYLIWWSGRMSIDLFQNGEKEIILFIIGAATGFLFQIGADEK